MDTTERLNKAFAAGFDLKAPYIKGIKIEQDSCARETPQPISVSLKDWMVTGASDGSVLVDYQYQVESQHVRGVIDLCFEIKFKDIEFVERTDNDIASALVRVTVGLFINAMAHAVVKAVMGTMGYANGNVLDQIVEILAAQSTKAEA